MKCNISIFTCYLSGDQDYASFKRRDTKLRSKLSAFLRNVGILRSYIFSALLFTSRLVIITKTFRM